MWHSELFSWKTIGSFTHLHTEQRILKALFTGAGLCDCWEGGWVGWLNSQLFDSKKERKMFLLAFLQLSALWYTAKASLCSSERLATRRNSLLIWHKAKLDVILKIGNFAIYFSFLWKDKKNCFHSVSSCVGHWCCPLLNSFPFSLRCGFMNRKCGIPWQVAMERRPSCVWFEAPVIPQNSADCIATNAKTYKHPAKHHLDCILIRVVWLCLIQRLFQFALFRCQKSFAGCHYPEAEGIIPIHNSEATLQTKAKPRRFQQI